MMSEAELALETSTINPAEEKNDEAPYGYKADGTPRKRPGRPAGSGGGGRKKSFEAYKEPLADRIVEYFGPPIGLASPLALATLEDRADKTAEALCTLAATRPRIAKLVQGMIAGSAVVDLAMTPIALLIAVSVEVGRVQPTSFAAHYFHIDHFYQELYGEEIAGQNGQVERRGLLRDLE